MRKRSTVVLAGLTATIVLGALVGGASARRLAFSNQSFRIAWASFIFEEGDVIQIECPLALEGSFHSRTISKVLEALVGYITRAIANEQRCEFNSSGKVLTTNLPWHVRYDGFTGVLLSITEVHVRIILFELLIQHPFPSQRCLYRSTAASPIGGSFGLNASRQIIQFIPDNTADIPLFMRLVGENDCATFLSVREEVGTVTLQGNTTKITVTLIA